MTRLKDIAERTGLSVNTVSLALRGSPRIPTDTQERVRTVALALDYTPNHAARALVSRQTMTVGLLVTDLTNPLLTQVAYCVEQALKAHGYVTLLAASNADADEEVRALATFRARQVDGVLAYPFHHGRLDPIRRLRAAGMPVVLLAGDAPGLDLVCVDERDGALQATRHLIEAGHLRLGLIDDSGATRGNSAKTDGFHDALRAAGIPPVPELHVKPGGDTVRHGYEAFARMMRRPDPPTAVLAADDRLALGGLRWCQEHGVGVPGGVAIFGYDNVEYSAFASTPLSSVDYPSEEVAGRAVQRLLALIDARDAPPPPEVVRIGPRLVLRDSTATVRAGPGPRGDAGPA